MVKEVPLSFFAQSRSQPQDKTVIFISGVCRESAAGGGRWRRWRRWRSSLHRTVRRSHRSPAQYRTRSIYLKFCYYCKLLQLRKYTLMI